MQPEFERFFDAVRGSRLAFPYCTACGRYHWYPMKRCPHCRSNDIEWRPVSGRGQLYSWTVVRHPFDPALAEALPYVVALIEFPDAPGIRLVSNLVDIDLDRLHIGMAVEPIYPDTASNEPVVRFRPITQG